MGDHRLARFFVLLLVSFAGHLCAQEPAPWHDPSPHSVQFVTAADNVKLEVLDWGGSGRPLVLLAGLGNTAHVFDDFAPKLTSEYHVYGVTRRGYGASSVPTSGYSADRLGDDVLAVLDVLKLDRPVLVGHSVAGEELSSVAIRHPERVAGLIYLDAGYAYAYYHASLDGLTIGLNDLQKKLEQLQPGKGPADVKPLVQALLQQDLPDFERELLELQEYMQVVPAQRAMPPSPSADDLASFSAFRSWFKRTQGITFPESELRLGHESTQSGGVGKVRSSPATPAILAGEQKYSAIHVPILAIYATPRDPVPFAYNTPAERAAAEVFQTTGIEAQAKAFENGIPSAHVVRVPHANHFIFLSNEVDVLREMRAFLGGLH